MNLQNNIVKRGTDQPVYNYLLQIENSYFPNWKSGELYNLPMPRPHCSTNMGMKLKLTCSISGAHVNDNVSY